MPIDRILEDARVFSRNERLSEEDAMVGRVSCLTTKEMYEEKGCRTAISANADHLAIEGRKFLVKGTRPNHRYFILKDIDLKQNAEGYILNEVDPDEGYCVRPLGYISHERLMEVGTRGGREVRLPLGKRSYINLREGVACLISELDSIDEARIGWKAA